MSNVLNMVSEESFIAQTEKIVKAITGESGTPFALAPEGTIQAAGTWFRVPYLGEAPAVQSATLILPDLPQGLVANSNWSVGFANGVANFTAINAADDTTYSGMGFVVIGNTAYKCTFAGLRVGYTDALVQPTNTVLALDYSVANTVDLGNVNGTRCVYGEKNIVAWAEVFTESGLEVAELEISSNGVITIPAGTFTDGGFLFAATQGDGDVLTSVISMNVRAAE